MTLPRLDLQVLRTLYLHELKMLGRDRRTLIMTFVVPLVLLPLYFWGIGFIQNRNTEDLEATTYTFAVSGSESASAQQLVSTALSLPVDSTSSTPVQDASFEEVDAEVPEMALAMADLHLVVEGMSADEWRSIVEEREDTDDASAEEPERVDSPLDTASVPVLRLHFRGNSERSSAAASRMAERLEAVRVNRREEALGRLGVSIATDSVIPVASTNIAVEGREAGALLGRVMTVMLLLLMLTGGSVVAADTIAGEKERGTLENLLTTAARRSEIVASKQLAVISIGVAIATLQIIDLLICLKLGIFDLPASMESLSIGPSAVAILLLLFVPVAVLVSSVLLLASGYAKSYKEYQIYFLPVLLLFLFPALAGILPGISLRSLIVVVPLANISVAVRDVLVGDYDLLFLFFSFLVTGLAALYAARLTSNTLSTERLITASELDRADLFGGPALFSRRVLRWFAAMWALLLITSIWIAPQLPIAGQVALNLFGIFLGGTVLMIRRYELPVREALALRLPHPTVWPIIVIAAPAGLITGIGLAEFLDLFVPVPQEVIEAFGQSLVPDGTPIWQIVFFLAIVPGVIEELAFRGVLLYGLRRKLAPATLAVTVGLIFGMFHVSIFRIGPTAYLGILLAAVVLLTGSIYPAMLWHFLNNAVALLAPYLGMPEDQSFPGWAYGAAALTLALCFVWLWKIRRVYPGLRTDNPPGKTRGTVLATTQPH